MNVATAPREAADSRAWLAGRAQKRRAPSAAQPLVLAGAEAAWLVLQGQVEVYAARRVATAHVERRHLFSARSGEALFGFAAHDDAFECLAVASADAQVASLDLREWLDPAHAPSDAAALVDVWLAHVCAALGASWRLPNASPVATVPAAQGEWHLQAGERLTSPEAPTWWQPRTGSLRWLQPAAWLARPGARLALAGRLSAQADEPARVRRSSSQELLRAGLLAQALRAFQVQARRALAEQQQARRSELATALRARAQGRRRTLRQAFSGLASLLSRRHAAAPPPTGDELLDACRATCVASGITWPRQAPPRAVAAGSVSELADALGLRLRRIALAGDWWRHDGGPLLGFHGPQRRPVALLRGARGYELHAAQAVPLRVTRALAAQLAPQAYMFYRRLPMPALRARDLLRFGLRDCGRDLFLLGLLGSGVGLLATALPLATGWIFDAVIPGAARAQLAYVVGGLVTAALAMSLLEITRSFALLRLEGRVGAALQAAVWDRLIELPATFFRRFTAGDLADRAFGVDTIRHDLSASVVTLVLATLFGGANLVLLCLLDARLGAVALLLLGFAALVGAGTAWRLLRLQRRATELHGRLSGLVVQLVRGLGKLRGAAAEARAFARWSEPFREARALALRTRAPLQVFAAAYPLLASMALYALTLQRPLGSRLAPGVFAAFVAAFGSVLLAQLQATSALLSVLHVLPTFERLQPILEAAPEGDEGRVDPGLLDGELELAHVSFSFSAEGPPVLRDVSLRLRPGEFVALVGASGSGKSTLLRLLLGFETPSAGHVYYSGQDLRHLDLRQVRRQIGVVLQNGQLLPGDILSNVQGSSHASREEVLEALRLAQLERDVAALPMGLHTLVSEGGATFSGGQRQRLLIARALLHKPRLLLLDEATSALDNESQAALSASLAQLDATRLVVAHRLSTIAHADRIVVLEQGRIVQVGRYAELLRQPGAFAELARRQLL